MIARTRSLGFISTTRPPLLVAIWKNSTRKPSAALGGCSSQQLLQSLHSARARERGAREVEATVVELGQLFSQVASLVAEQGDVIERIDADMDAAGANVEAGYSELGKFYQSVRRNRGVIVRLLAVAAFVVLLFGVFRPSTGARRAAAPPPPPKAAPPPP